MRIVLLDQANHTEVLSGRGCWARWAVPMPQGLLASEYGRGSYYSKEDEALGANGEYSHIPFSQEPEDTSQEVCLEQETLSRLLGLGAPCSVCPAPVLIYRSYPFFHRTTWLPPGDLLRWICTVAITSRLLRQDPRCLSC